jgi:GNAT superfamily N-acetyltransferase
MWTPRDKIEESFLAPVGSAVLANDTRIVERDGWYQIITPSSGSTAGNEVVYSRLGPGEAEEVVRRTIAEYTAAGVPFKWCVGPLTEPAGFGELLERHGFVGWDIRGMAIDPATWTPAARPGITVEPVGPDGLLEYLDTFARGWEVSFDVAAWCRDHRRALDGGRHHLVLARVDGEPAGTAGFILRPRAAYLVGGNVLPAFRGRGVYRALIDDRLGRLRERGVSLATTQAREATSAPILERLGFETLFRSRVYRSELSPPPDPGSRTGS